MKKNSKNSLVITFIILLALAVNSISIANGETKYSLKLNSGDIITVDDDGDEDYTHIQEAIDAAEPGTIILVYSGTYIENIIMNKQLILIGIEENEEGIPVINPVDSSSTVTITADRCTLNGFKVMGGKEYLEAGIKIISDHNLIKNNVVFNSSFYGINLYRSKYNSVSDNYIYENNWGIKIQFSHKNIINGNTLRDNWVGIWLHYSLRNTIRENSIDNNYYGIESMFKSNRNNIVLNNIRNNSYGLDFFKSEYNTILENNIENSTFNGIRIWGCDLNRIKYNNITNSGYHGIQIYLSVGTIIDGNSIKNNTEGILLRTFGGAHIIKHNNFIGNNVSASFNETFFNLWFENYWDDWSGQGPQPIHGRIKIRKNFSWVAYDRHPLEEPYVK